MRTFSSLYKSIFLGLFVLTASANSVVAQQVEITGIPAAAFEGTGAGTTAFTFTLMRTGPGVAFNVPYTITGDVVAPEDYTALSATVAFTAAQTTRTITVAVKRDTKFEIDEDITLTLGIPDNFVVLGPTMVGTTTVLNDDTAPTISIGNRTVSEGGFANFAVTLSNSSYQAVSVTATTADGTANGVVTSPFPQADYTSNAPGGTVVTFAPNATVLSQNFGVPTINDLVHEGASPETFFANLSGPANGSIGIGTGNGFITDNDLIPQVSVTGPGSQSESSVNYDFTVSLTRQSSQSIDVTVSTADGTASATAAPFPMVDYAAAPTVLTFAPGETSKTYTVTISEDGINENAETFLVQLSGLSNVNAGTVSKTGTILDNDAAALPLLEVLDIGPVNETAPSATFTITLSAQSGKTVSVKAQTTAASATATAGSDYTAAGPTTYTWAPGDTTPRTFVVPLLDDNVYENNETIRVFLNTAANAGFTVGGTDGFATIISDEAKPTVSISPAAVQVTEGNSPTTTVVGFTVSLSGPSQLTSSVGTATANGTATSGSDYVVRPITTLTFAPLQTSQVLNVTVNGDNALEPDEFFYVNLTNPINVDPGGGHTGGGDDPERRDPSALDQRCPDHRREQPRHVDTHLHGLDARHRAYCRCVL